MKKLFLSLYAVTCSVGFSQNTWTCGEFQLTILSREIDHLLLTNMLVKGKDFSVVGYPTFRAEGNVDHYKLESNETYEVTYDRDRKIRTLNGVSCE